MRIYRDRATGLWVLSSAHEVLYQGRRSPWSYPEIIQDAWTRASR